ncbi:MAG: DUF4292 domain-containing protein [Bacteroidota bacterium]
MKNPFLSFAFITVLLLPTLTGCELFRNIGNKPKKENADYALAEEIINNPFDFKEIAISGKADIRTPDLNLGANYRIHIQKDKQILIKVSKFVEVVKILITTDSIFVQDKLNQAYYACDYSLAKEYLGVEADFEMIQALFLGDYAPIPSDMKLSSPPESNPLKFSGSVDSTKIVYYLDRELKKLVRLSVENPAIEGQSDAFYKNFEKVNNQNFPMILELIVPAPLDGTLTFKHRRVQVNPANLSFSFDIPSGFSKQDCP